MANFNGIGTDVVEGGVFDLFPELVPAIGNQYWSDNHSKLLLIGESNYFPNEWDETKSVFKDEKKWYDQARLDYPRIPKEKIKDVGNWKSDYPTFNRPYQSIKNVMESVGIETNYGDLRDFLHETAFYNYFLRPAANIKGQMSFKHYCKPVDELVSGVTLCGIIDVMKPDIIIFLSKYAYSKFAIYRERNRPKFSDVIIDYVNHPAHPAQWYNRNGQGKTKFEHLLLEHWLYKKPAYYLNFDKLKNIHNQLKQKLNVEKEPECGIWKDEKGVLLYISKLYFKVNDHSFFYQTSIEKGASHYWTYFRPVSESQDLKTILDKYKYNFPSTKKNEEIVEDIEKLIHQVIGELSK